MMTALRQTCSQINLFLRSLLFSIYSLLSIFLYSFVVVAAIILPLQTRHALIRAYLRAYLWVLKKLCHIDFQVHGLEHIPREHAGVVLCKHQSTWETFFLPLVFHNPAVILKRELLWLPFFGWGLAASDPIAINRNDKSSAMQQIITKGKKCLTAGRWIIVFPEGTRTAFGSVGHYKLGGARLAVATAYPVIPVAHNAGLYWPRRKFIKKPGTIHVVIGPEISTQGKTAEAVLELAKQWIETTVLHINRFVDETTRQ